MSRKIKARKAESVRKRQHRHHPLPASGCWINIFDPIIGELAGACGYDYAVIDMEHSPSGIDAALPMIRAVQLGGAKAIVRAPDKQLHWISRLMDMAADGVMVPMVDSGQEAEKLAGSCVYAPDGTRGMAAGIVRASRYGVDTQRYLETYRQKFLLMVQIETRAGVASVDEIAAVDGIDCLFVGPFDLSGSLGYPAQPDHKATLAAIRRIVRAGKQAGKPVSTLTTPARKARKLFSSGFDLVFSGSDVTMIREAMQADAANNRKLLESGY